MRLTGSRPRVRVVFLILSTGCEAVARRSLIFRLLHGSYSDPIDKNCTVPNKLIATQPHLPLAHLDPINSSPLANAKDFDSTSECGENVNAAGEVSKDVPFPLGAEIKLIDDAFATCQEESDLFLHPRPEANFDYWAKVPVWTLDEAIALSFGKKIQTL